MDTMLKLVTLYRIISAATDQEISILLGYAQNLVDSRPKAIAIEKKEVEV